MTRSASWAHAAPTASKSCRDEASGSLARPPVRAVGQLRPDDHAAQGVALFAGCASSAARPGCSSLAGFARHAAGAVPGPAAAWPATLPHLLHALSLRAGRRQRHGRAARLSASSVLRHRAAAQRPNPALLRRDHQWLRRHVLLRRSYRPRRSLGDCRLYPCPPVVPACNARITVRCAARRTAMIHERAELIAWAVGIIGLALALLGWLLEPTVFPHAWLAALSSWIGWPLGCLALLLIHTLTGGRWGEAIQPQLVSGIGILPLLLPALLPLIFVLPELYPWWRPDAAAHFGNGFYLNRPFAIARAIIYLIAWYGVAAATMFALRLGRIQPALAVAGLLLLGLTASFAAIDATMSLDPHFS